jgi:hypothetical protein
MSQQFFLFISDDASETADLQASADLTLKGASEQNLPAKSVRMEFLIR